jgi:hypothetical protein
MKLSEGDKIEVTGLPIEAGVYWIAYISYVGGATYYGLRKFYGRDIAGRFYTNLIDALLGDQVRRAA